LHAALTLELDQPLLQQLDPFAEQTTVGFELRFARTAQSDPAFLPLQVGPAANQRVAR
jgi:hypothetical protein